MVEFISNSFILGVLRTLSTSVHKFGYANLLATLVAIKLAQKIAYALFFSPLRNVPGPFFARLTSKRAGVLAAAGKMGQMAEEEYEKYGDIYVYQPNAVSICNPRDIRAVLGSQTFRKTDFYKAIDLLDIENTASTTNPELANLRRRQLGPYFTHGYLANMEDLLINHGAVAIKKKWDSLIEQNGGGSITVNYKKDFLYATFDVIGALMFGREFRALANDDNTVPNWIDKSVAYLGARTNLQLLTQFPFSLILKPWENQYNALVEYSANAIKARRQLLQSLGDADDKKPKDLLQAFIDAEDPESKIKMSPIEVHSESVLMLLTGSETSASSSTWALHLLTLYPQHYRRAVDEVRSKFDKDHLIRYAEGRKSLPFLEACIYESMRLIPVGGAQWPRLTPKEGIHINGHFIPQGTEINVNLTAANLHKETWADPYLFNPDRFLNNDEAKRNALAFSTGVRICPGRNLAWIEMFTILANILNDYDFKLLDSYKTFGPGIVDERGYPKIMDSEIFMARVPKYPEQDCQIQITKRT